MTHSRACMGWTTSALLTLAATVGSASAGAQTGKPRSSDSSRTEAQCQRRDSLPCDPRVSNRPRTGRLAPVIVRGARLTEAADASVAATVDAVRPTGQPPSPASLASALARLPGVSVYDDQGTRAQPTLDIRGFALSPVVGVPQGVSVFLDGVRVNEADAQEMNFDLIPLDAIARAELVRGPQPVFGKNSLAGALLLTTRRGDATPRVEASADAGAFGYRAARLTASGAAGGFDGFAMVRASDEDGWRVDTPARTRLLFASAGRRRDDEDVALTILAGQNRIFQAGSLPESWLAIDRRANFTAGDFYAPTLLHVALRAERSHLRASVFTRHNDTERFNVNGGAASVRSRTVGRSVGVTSEVDAPTHVLGIPLATVAGLELARHLVTYRVNQEPSGDATPDEDCEPVTGLCERANVNEDDAAVYAQVVFDLPARLTLTTSARADWVRIPFRDLRDSENDGTSTFRRISPRAGLSWRPSARGRAFVAVGTGFRAPAALELACADETAPCTLPFALGDDPPLAPVRVQDAEVGGELTVMRGVQLTATAWRATVRDEIVFVASRTTAGYFRNVARTSRAGVEVETRAALPHGMRANASYAWLDARWRSSAQLASALPDAAPVRPGDPMPMSPSHRATAAIGFTRAKARWLFDGEASLHAVSQQWLRGDEAGRTAPLPGYATAELRLAAERGRVGVAVSITNLTGSRASTFGIYGVNTVGAPGGATATNAVERFTTPLAPRALTVTATFRGAADVTR